MIQVLGPRAHAAQQHQTLFRTVRMTVAPCSNGLRVFRGPQSQDPMSNPQVRQMLCALKAQKEKRGVERDWWQKEPAREG